MFLTVAKIVDLRPVPLSDWSHSVYHCTRLNCGPFLIDFARVTSVRLVTHNEFDFIRLKQVAQLWQRDRASSAILRGWVTLRLNIKLKGYVSHQYIWR